MIDEVQQTFVRSFIDYLKKLIGSQAFSPDAQESCEVAIQCLQAAFDLGEEEAVEQSQTTAQPENAGATSSTEEKINPISLFELYESQFSETSPEKLKLAESIKNEGNRLMKDGKYNEALLQYNRAITYDPKNPIFYCNRAAAYIRLGDNDRAIIDCKSALVYNPNYGKAYGRLGIAYSNLGKYEEAQQAYTKAIELEPDNQDYHNNLEVARNARNAGMVPQMANIMNSMLSNPFMRNLLNSTDIDMESLRMLVQTPAVMTAIDQLFSATQHLPVNSQGGNNPDAANTVRQLIQNLGLPILNNPAGTNQPQPSGDNNPPSNTDQKEPPSN